MNKLKIQLKKIAMIIYGNNIVRTAIPLLVATFFSMFVSGLFVSQINVSLFYMLAVVVVSVITPGYAYGIAASIIAVVGVNYFFTAPYFGLDFTRTGYPITFVTMLLVAMISCAITSSRKEQARLAEQREKRTLASYEITRQMLAVRDVESILRITARHLSDNYDMRVAIFYGEPKNYMKCIVAQDKHLTDRASEDEMTYAQQAYHDHENASEENLLCLPMLSHQNVIGVMCMSGKKVSTIDEQSVMSLQMLLAQIVMAVDCQILSDERHRIRMEAEKEKTRANLLRAISHDIRTPLTSMTGASAAMLENDSLDEQSRRQLTQDIHDDALWLTRVVENLLSITKISDGLTPENMQVEAVEEIAAESAQRVRARYPGKLLSVRTPDEFVLVRMAGTLIEQVLINLMENALIHSGTDEPVELTVTCEGDAVRFTVRDYGRGIDPELLPYLFTSGIGERRTRADHSRGLGIGLSICQNIVQAHGSVISVRNMPDKGAQFTFTLPREEESPHEQDDYIDS